MISQKVDTTLATTWLEAYTIAVNNSTQFEQRQEQREWYTHPSQLLPDYLDYKEEWEYAVNDMIEDVRSSFVLRMGKTKLHLKCDCGVTHRMTTFAQKQHAEEVPVDDPTDVPQRRCWYQTIDKAMEHITKSLRHEAAAELPTVLARNLQMITQWYIAKSGRTPTLLPYEVYKEVWWAKDVEGLNPQLTTDVFYALNMQSRRAIVTQVEQETRTPEMQRYFFTNEEVIADHGLHALATARQHDFGEILKFLNQMRKKIGGRTRIRRESIDQAIKQCSLCEGLSPPLSPFGIYAALPGAGKTTAQNMGLLVGFDTDWIGIGFTWRDLGMILYKEIPVITNQPKIFIGAGVKIQFMLKEKIREDGRGRPMGNYHAMKAWAEDRKSDVTLHLMNDNEFVADKVLHAHILAHFQATQMKRLLNGKPPDVEDIEYNSIISKRLREQAIGKEFISK